MQFYIIHDDPIVNAKILPDYCLKKVNIREGWQMLSDIGHLFEVSWDGQNSLYNSYHAETRRYWRNKYSFFMFISYYHECLIEYFYRFGKTTVFHRKFNNLIKSNTITVLAEKIGSKLLYDKDQIVKYLLDTKTQHLNNVEIERLNNLS
jgi:hypothetical protein